MKIVCIEQISNHVFMITKAPSFWEKLIGGKTRTDFYHTDPERVYQLDNSPIVYTDRGKQINKDSAIQLEISQYLTRERLNLRHK